MGNDRAGARAAGPIRALASTHEWRRAPAADSPLSAQRQAILVVHGGAGKAASLEDAAAYRVAVEAALYQGRELLHIDAREAVVAAVAFMEESTLLNAGVGAVLGADGKASLDAGFMDGGTQRFGGVAGVSRCATPVRIAQSLSRDGEAGRFLHGTAADDAARIAGIPTCDPAALVTERSRARFTAGTADSAGAWGDTVGAVALDAAGRSAAAVSTGGLAGKRPGRVGDSPVVGAGFWADDRYGACVTSGIGEILLREGTARRCIQWMMAGRSVVEATRLAMAELASASHSRTGVGGVIAVGAGGEFALAHDTDEMTAGWVTADAGPVVKSAWS